MSVLQMSALDVDLETFAAEAPDVMIVDPPYSRHVHKNAVSQSVGGGSRQRDLGFEHLSPALRRRIAGFAALTKRWSLIYTDLESMAWWRISLQAAGATYIRAIPWVRWSLPQLSGDRPPTGCEMLIVAYGNGRGKKHWNGPGNLLSFAHSPTDCIDPIGMIDTGPGNLLSLTHTCLRGEGKHKAEKPLDQMLDLVTYFSDVGECVFDPCSGSGTTGLASKLLGRQFVGLEIDERWATFANQRMQVDGYSQSGPTAPILTERDQTRFDRWKVSQLVAQEDRKRVDANTAKMRAKADAKKAAEGGG